VTVKSLIKTLLRSDYGVIAARERMWHEQEVWRALQPILMETLNVRPEQIVADAHLVYDLGPTKHRHIASLHENTIVARVSHSSMQRR
jgi:hypothetical protein